ncbi:MAG: hypothetical protein JWO89_456 [Verrucomicrobiaceae bacterium]|nr:hypothetical protein [Verrucomicrobiaceae bacterium]
MKSKSLLLLAFLATTACGLRAQSSDSGDLSERGEKIRYQLILPDEKAPEVVKPSEPNPFSKADNHAIKEDGASGEENRVREILAGLPITGYVDGGVEGPRVLVGPMKLRRGDFVPKVLAEQSVMLRVNSISREQIDLIWVEKKSKNSGLAPRVVTLPVRVKPKVRIALPSLPAAPEAGRGGNFIFQNDASMQANSDTPPETRKAVAADSSTPPPASTAPGKTEAEHPANMLMNYLFKSASKTVDTPPSPSR